MREDGFSLIELLVAMLLITFCLLSIVPLFLISARSTASASEITTLSAEASERMEFLMWTDFDTLTAGGSLTSNSTGFFDSSNPDHLLRWTVTDDATPPTMKTIQLWAQAVRAPIGRQKEMTMMAVRADTRDP